MITTQSPSLRIAIPAIICCLLMGFLPVLGQGTVNFNNRVTGTLVTHIYNVDMANDAFPKFGNTSTDTPAGTQSYSSSALTGSGWLAQLWAAPGSNQPESALQPASSYTTFRTGTSSGNVAPVTMTLTGVPKDCPVATVQVRVWSSVRSNWIKAAEFNSYGLGPPLGKSLSFNLSNIGGDLNSAPYPIGLESFSLYDCLCEHLEPPHFFYQPQSARLSVGQSTNLWACIGHWYNNYAFQWRRNGTNITDWTSPPTREVYPSLVISNAQPSDAGVYTLVATNSDGVRVSSGAVITVGGIGLISATKAAGQVVLNWQGAFYLQTATNVSGPFLDLPGPVLFGPFTNVGSGSPKFFRLRN